MKACGRIFFDNLGGISIRCKKNAKTYHRLYLHLVVLKIYINLSTERFLKFLFFKNEYITCSYNFTTLYTILISNFSFFDFTDVFFFFLDSDGSR